MQFSLVDWRLEAPWFACANSWVWLPQSRPAAVVVLPSLEMHPLGPFAPLLLQGLETPSHAIKF